MEETEQTTVLTPRSVGVRYGVIYGTISIVIFVGMSLSGIDMGGPLRWLSSVVAIGIMILAHKYFKDNGDGFMEYNQGLRIGVFFGLAGTVMSSIFTYIYIKFVDDNLIQAARDKAIHDMQEKGSSDEQIEVAMKFVDMFTTAESILAFGLVGGFLMIFIIGVIVSAFTKKPRPVRF